MAYFDEINLGYLFLLFRNFGFGDTYNYFIII